MELSVHNVSHFRKRNKVLSHVTFDLDVGLYILLGSNGSGKTTLIRSLASVIKPSDGFITFNHLDIFSSGIRYREILGYAPQHFGYFPFYTVKKFLLYIATLKGIGKSEAQDRIEEALLTLHLSEYQDIKMKNLSEGIKKRVNIAQSLLNNPKVLLLDEPTSGLDINESIFIRNLLSNLARDRVVLYSSHLMRDLESEPKELILLDKGQVMAKKGPRVLLKQLEGKVWEMSLTKNPSEPLRFYSASNVPNARLVPPIWEDIHFLYDSNTLNL